MNRWQVIQTLFNATAELDEAERGPALAAATTDDPELKREVEALLAADRTEHSALDQTASELVARFAAEPAVDSLCGSTCGPYHIEAHLVSGGMGHVYRGVRRIEGTTRRVAIKVLRAALASPSTQERFARERQTLASLEHEHIVAFLDAGSLPDGRPFFVMEFVDGTPLLTWAKDKTMAARIALLKTILHAVQYAHQHLIIHRDLKPSNVLVTTEGTPKLLDFGVAALIDAEADTSSSERSPLTPAYASPECLRGDQPTTTSDIYSLGVLARELFGKEAPRDLLAITTKASAEDPHNRYPSADLMADDLQRYREHKPLAARPHTWRYRTTCFFRRQRYAIAIGAALLAAMTIGWTGAVLDRRSAEVDAALGWRAHAQAKLAARLFDGWITTIATGDAALADAAAVHLETALREELSDWPEAEALVRMTLAELYLTRGENPAARAHAQRALDLSQSTRGLGEPDRQRADALWRRAHAESGR